MQSIIKKWNGIVLINGQEYEGNMPKFKPNEQIHINLKPINVKAENGANNKVFDSNSDTQFKITVKQYMTKKATPDFDFMLKWNNDNPMPLRVMVGKKLQETKGMVKMELHGDIFQEITPCCMKCGKKITNPVSRFFGMGPECGGHNYNHPFESDEQLRQAILEYKTKLQQVTWTGWVVKSAIEHEEIIGG